MADLATVEAAFLRAHQAGDAESAGVLAGEVRRLRAAQPSTPPGVIPVDPTLKAPAATGFVPQSAPYSLGEKIIGAGQAARHTIGNLLASPVTLPAMAIGEAIGKPDLGSRVASALVDQPSSPAGQEYANALGVFMQRNGPALIGLAGAPRPGIKPAARAINDADMASSVKPALSTAEMSAIRLEEPRLRGIVAARDAGLVIPPSQAGGGALSRSVESLSGEPKVQKLFSQKNAPVMNKMIGGDFKLADDVPLTHGSIAEVRARAGEAYEPIKKAGEISVGPEFFAEMQSAGKGYTTAAESFSHRSENPLKKVYDGLVNDPMNPGVQRSSFNAASAVEEVKLLRADADKAYAARDKQLGGVYRKFAEALDNQIDRSLQASSDPALRTAIADYRAARKTIAKTYLADDALNSETGNINAAVYAKALANKVPLDGGALEVAKFAKGFERAAQRADKIGNASGPTIFDGIAAVAGKTAALIGARPLARSALGTEFVQNRITQGARDKLQLLNKSDTPPPLELAPIGSEWKGSGRPAPPVGPLGDLTPDWGTSRGFEPRQPGIEPNMLYRAFGDDPAVHGRAKGRPQMPVAPGLPGVGDVAVAGGRWIDAAEGARNRLSQAPASPAVIEWQRLAAEPNSSAKFMRMAAFARLHPEFQVFFHSNSAP